MRSPARAKVAQRRHRAQTHSAPDAPPQTPGTPLLEAARAASRSHWRRMTRSDPVGHQGYWPARAGRTLACVNIRVGREPSGTLVLKTARCGEYSVTAIGCQVGRHIGSKASVLPRSSLSSSDHSLTETMIGHHRAENASSARQTWHSLGKARAPSSQRPRTGQLGQRISRPSTRRRLTRRRVRFAS